MRTVAAQHFSEAAIFSSAFRNLNGNVVIPRAIR
jgi:hypothetical protein